MDIILYSNKMDEYLKHDSVIDYDNKAIIELADTLFKKANNTEQAISLLMDLPITSNCNILLADQGGRMVVVECSPSTKNIRGAEKMNHGKIIYAVTVTIAGRMA